MSENLGFGGEVAALYHRYRRGYPTPVIDRIAASSGLAGNDVVIDLGCGTGQLALPVARRVRAVAGVDPEPDMLARARQAAAEDGIANVTWMLGSDADIAAVSSLLGGASVGAVTIGQALHWMDSRTLLPALVPLLRPGGGITVISNGTPMWLQASPWSRALRGFLEEWLGRTLTRTCGTGDADRKRYRATMLGAGLHVTETVYAYDDELDLDRVIGGVCSALPVQKLPDEGERKAFAEGIRRALASHAPFTEHVPVRVMTGRVPGP